MTFDELLSAIIELLQRQGRVSYGALRRRFALDDAYLTDIKTELIDAQRIAADEGGKVLVWVEPEVVSSSTLQVSRFPSSTFESRPLILDQQTSDLKPQTWNLERADGDRRQLTVMFCELGKSADVEEQGDPEDWQEALRIARRTCEEIINRYEGYITQSLADGMVVYWGYPRAHEDDACRAVQAGLDIVRAIQHLDYWPFAGIPLVQSRVSIHTGPVIVDTTPAQPHREPSALGLTPQVAIHLLASAAPNTVILGNTTYQLVGGYFTCRSLARHELPNVPEPVQSYLVLSESGARHRLEVTTLTGLTPFTGREEESNLLRKRWEQVREGQGQVVLISGEAGIGKSRLVQELKEQLLQEQSICVEARCSAYHQQSAFYPVIDYIQRSLQFGREESVEAKRQKLERTLVRAHIAEKMPIFANLLGLPMPSGEYTNLSPQRQREQLLHEIGAWFFSLAERKPVLTVWEDLHWADPSTLELLQLLLEQLPMTRILAVFTFRPEFVPAWPLRSHVTSLVLGRLGSRHAEVMIENIAKGKLLPEEVQEQIVEKTDGVPLFIEELTKMVLESGLVKEDNEAYHLVGPLPPLAIPTTLQDSLLARLDRLSDVREVAQVGAVLEREFSPDVLHAVLGGEAQAVQDALAQLVAAEVLYRRGVTTELRYVFKHALIQDAAYQSLVKGRRQQYHQQIARVLDERFPEIRETQPELLAHHYTEAGAAALAVPAWLRAGRRAIDQSAFVEATEHLSKGLAVLRTLPETAERDQQELQVCTLLGPTLMALRGYSVPEVEELYSRALALCQRIGDTPRLFQVHLGLAFFHLARGQLQTARQQGEQCFTLAQQDHKPLRLLQAHVALANILFYQGEFQDAERHLRDGIALYATVQPQAPPQTLQDPGVNALTSLQAWTSWCLGYPDRAARQSEEAVALATQLERPLSQVIAAIFASGVRILRGEETVALQYADQALALATDKEFSLWAAYGKIMRGRALGLAADPDDAIAQIQHGLSIIRAMRADLVQSWLVSMLANVYAQAGKVAEGLAIITKVFAVVEDNGEHAFLAELYRLKGELMLEQLPILKSEGEAEACFLTALDVARQQQAKSWELRAAMSLYRLRHRQVLESTTRDVQDMLQTRREEAHRLLAEIYTWFTEGFETKDLQEAKALLESLGSGVM